MQCRKCGAEIADKALICYRCGTATTDPIYKPAVPRRSSAALVASVLALVLLLILALYMGRMAVGATPRAMSWIAVVIAVIVVILRAIARRR